MNWLKQNWLWLIINIIAIAALLSVFSTFNIEPAADGTPQITVETPQMPDREFESDFEQDAQTSATTDTGDRPERSPYSFLVKSTGESAIRWLIVSLTATPLYILFGWRKMLTIKKATGLYAFTFAALHMLFFAVDRGWLATFDEVNFVLGLLSLLIMIPLALTSNQWSMKWLGKRWKWMHRAAYAAGLLAVLHVLVLGEGSGVLYALILTIGLAVRLPQLRKMITSRRNRRLQTHASPA